MRMRGKDGMAKPKAAVPCTKKNLALNGQSCAWFVWNACEYLQPEGSGRTAGHCQVPPRSICPHNLPPPARTDGLCNVPYHRQPICSSPTRAKIKEKSAEAKQLHTRFSLTNKTLKWVSQTQPMNKAMLVWNHNRHPWSALCGWKSCHVILYPTIVDLCNASPCTSSQPATFPTAIFGTTEPMMQIDAKTFSDRKISSGSLQCANKWRDPTLAGAGDKINRFQQNKILPAYIYFLV